MIARRKLLIAFGAGGLVAPLSCFAQQKDRVWRIGYVGLASAIGPVTQARLEGLKAGLRDLGYVEGRNLAIEFRWAEEKYERLPALFGELIRLKVDVIVTHGTPGIRAAKQATAMIPIVMATVSDPVATGLVASLRQPGGNVTGVMFFTQELNEKRMEMVKEVFPKARRVAVLANPLNDSMKPIIPALEVAAKALKLEFRRFDARGPEEFEAAFSAMAAWRADALLAIEDAMLIANSRMLVEHASKRRLPLIGWNEIADAGGFLSYGVNFPEMYRRAAYFVDRIFKGAKPAELPVERSTKFELVINMKTVKALGVKLPQSVLVRADRVIE